MAEACAERRFAYDVQHMFLDDRVARVINFILNVIEALLGVRFLFTLFGANEAAWFSQIVYTLSDPLMIPFERIFQPTTVQGLLVDWSILLAMAVYYLFAFILVRALRALLSIKS